MNTSEFDNCSLNKKEKLFGMGYWLFETFLLSLILRFFNSLLPAPLPNVEINFLFFLTNFIAVAVIFRKYLWEQVLLFLRRPWNVLCIAIPGLAVYWVLNVLMGQLLFALDPQFVSVNDVTIRIMVEDNYVLMFLSTVFLVPIGEECLFRGLLFRGVHDHNIPLAWILSIVMFSMAHISGYIGVYPMGTILLCFVQYLPAGLCLAGAYRLSGSLFAPIFIHMMVNLVAMLSLR